MKVTKKEISQTLSGVQELSKAACWPVQEIGAYTKDEQIHLYVIYQGRGGIDKNVYAGVYDDIYNFTDFYNHWINRTYTKVETINRIYLAVNNKFSN